MGKPMNAVTDDRDTIEIAGRKIPALWDERRSMFIIEKTDGPIEVLSIITNETRRRDYRVREVRWSDSPVIYIEVDVIAPRIMEEKRGP